MRTTISIFFFLLCINVCRADDVVLDTYSAQNDSGKAVYYYCVTQARRDSQPAWEPGKQPIPLSIDKAIQVAQAWIKKQPWSENVQDINQITLEHASDPSGCWFYSIDFDCNDTQTSLHPNWVMVLLDGSVVEPTQKRPKNYHSSDFNLN